MKVRARKIKQRKEIKGIRTRKEEIKLFLFTDGMIWHTENPKESTIRINTRSEVAGYKINTQKSIVFLHTCNEN